MPTHSVYPYSAQTGTSAPASLPASSSRIAPPGGPEFGLTDPPQGASQGASLGIYAKSRAALDFKGDFSGASVDPETGEISLPQDPAAVRLERFALQSVARSILPKARTAKCLRVPFARSVGVFHSQAQESAHYGGLVTCASVWACPICAAKISERRRRELQHAMALCEAQGGSVALLTLTHGHSLGDRLGDLLAAEQKALHAFFSFRAGKRLMSAVGRVGHVRAWEITHGRLRDRNNGWHPHFHILLFLETKHGDLSGAEEWGYAIWLNACQLAGLPLPDRRHGITIQDGANAAAYVAKFGQEAPKSWGLDAEMTKGHIKRARDGETPWDFLRSCLLQDDPQARRLFREYAECFKGKRQLVWSRGLRELLGLEDLSDEDLASRQEEDAYLLANLSLEQWRIIRASDRRGEVLEVARHGDPQALNRYLDAITSRP